MRNLLKFATKRPIVITLFVALLGAALFGAVVPSANNAALAESRDCDDNAMMYCGAYSAAEFQQKYNANSSGDLPAIYAHYGVNPAELNGARSGQVTPDGKVIVDGKTVATGAYTAGRQSKPQSHTITINGRTYYERNNTSNLARNFDAFVVFDQFGRFKYAVIKDCGNPVPATPVQPPAAASCDSLTGIAVDRTKFNFTTKASASNGGAVTGYVYSFGDGVTQSGSATISHTYTQPGTYTVTVTAKTNLGDRTGPNCKTTVTVEKEKTPGISIEKLVNGKKNAEVQVDQQFNYQLTVTNTGETDLKDAKVTDPAPANVVFVSAAEGTIRNNQWSTTIPTLKVGESKTFTIVAKVTKEVANALENTACVDAPTIPGNPDDCSTATVTVPQTPVTPPVTPPQLPHTGIVDGILSVIGLGALVASSIYFVISRIRA